MSIMITTPLVIGPGSIGTNELVDDGVTAAKIGSGAATDGQVLTADGAGGAAWGDVTIQQSHSVYCLGDSLTETTTYPNKLGQLLGADWRVHNRGIGGERTEHILRRYTAEILNAGDGEYVVVLAGINDVIADLAAATIKANLQTIYTACYNAGMKVVAVTITPFKTHASWSAPRQAVLDEVNAWILATAVNVVYRINAYDVLEDPAAPDTLLPAYDYDHIHLSTAGYDLLATTIYAGCVWTKSSSNAGLEVAGVVQLNQPLLNTSSPTFVGLTTRGLKVTTGFVGIGTSSPAAELHIVNGSLLLENPLIGLAQIGLSVDSGGALLSSPDSDVLQYKGYRHVFLSHTGVKIATLNEYRTLGIGYDTPSASTEVSLTVANRVGIGTTAPTAALHVPASSTARASLRVPDGTAPTAPNAGDVWAAGGKLYFYDGATTKEIAFV